MGRESIEAAEGLAAMIFVFAIIAVSYLVYRCAAANNRRPILWVVLLWIIAHVTGIAVATVVAVVLFAQGREFATEKEFTYALLLPAIAGNVAGAIVTVRLANRPADRPLRFSLRTLFIVSTLAALGLGWLVWMVR